jgi:hypothetical protein
MHHYLPLLFENIPEYTSRYEKLFCYGKHSREFVNPYFKSSKIFLPNPHTFTNSNAFFTHQIKADIAGMKCYYWFTKRHSQLSLRQLYAKGRTGQQVSVGTV